MARIVYGCCGEGQGHSSRTLTMTRALQQQGHEVLVLAARKAFQVLHPLLPDVREIPGLFLVYRHNRVQLAATAWGNLQLLARKRSIARNILRVLDDFQPDLAITDFDPFLPIAARLAGLPFISLDHQHVIPHLQLRVPPALKAEFQLAKWIVNLTHRGERANLVTSFFHAERVPARVHCLPPILREEVLRLRPENRGHVVVYQTSSSFAGLPALLKELPFEFRIYAFDREGRDGNLVFRPRATSTFLEDVATADWVLSNGGYTLLSECLHLGKPVFSVPVDRQFEQWLNAHHLERLGYGMMAATRDFNAAKLNEFIVHKEDFRRRIAGERFNGNHAALAAIGRHLDEAPREAGKGTCGTAPHASPALPVQGRTVRR